MPTSYQAPSRGDQAGKTKTVSQSSQTNMAQDKTTVEKLLKNKGGNVFSLRAQNSIEDAVKFLSEKKIGAVLVVNTNGDLEGILSERDIVRRLADEPDKILSQTVGDMMTSKVETCTPDEMLSSVLKRMTKGRFRHMPVVDKGKLCGVVTIGDVVHFRLNELELETLQLKQMIVG